MSVSTETLKEIGRQIADAAINAGIAIQSDDYEKHTRLSNKVQTLLGELERRDSTGAIEASGRVTVDRARFERVLKPMQLYVQAEGIVVDFTGKGAIAFGKAFEDAVNEIRANPGDLEPLP